MYGTVEGLSTFYYQPKQYCKQFHTHDTCDSPHSERLHKPLFPAAWGNTWEAQNYITYTQNSCYGFVYMCVCICVRVCWCVYSYVCVCVGLCNTQEHPGLPDTLWFYPESRMGISQKCWVLQSKADNCYLTKNLGPFRFKRTFLCTREWWLQYVKCWDPPLVPVWLRLPPDLDELCHLSRTQHLGSNTLTTIAIDRAAIILQSVFPYQTLLKSAPIQRIQTGGSSRKEQNIRKIWKYNFSHSFCMVTRNCILSLQCYFKGLRNENLLQNRTMHINLPEMERKCSWN